MDQQVHLPDGRQKLVAQPFALGGALDQAGHVHELDAGRGELLGFEQPAQLGEARVGTGANPVLGAMVLKG